jgi:hypothetical protein
MQTIQNNSNPSLSTLLVIVFLIIACVVAFFLTAKQSASREETPTAISPTTPQHATVG